MSQARRGGFSLIELLVVLAIIAVLMGLLVGGVIKVRAAAARVACQSHLRQLGTAIFGYYSARDQLPPGMVCRASNVADAEATGFTYLLPFLEEDSTYKLYDFDQPWFNKDNFEAVGTPVRYYYCPGNRSQGAIDLASIGTQWGFKLPPTAASCDYAFSKGANGALPRDSKRTPLAVRGAFGTATEEESGGVRLEDILDHHGSTYLMGDAAGNNPRYEVRDLNNEGQSAIDPTTGKPARLEQSWSAAGATDASHPWYASVFAVTAQFGMGTDPRDEPMNRRPGTPTIAGGDPAGDNSSGKDYVSGFRSMHPGGCNFLFADGSVRFVPQTISPELYRAHSTIAGSETIKE